MPTPAKREPGADTHQRNWSARWLLAAGVGAIAAVVAARRVRSMATVAPELRGPLLLAPTPINGFTRPLMQWLMKSTNAAIPAGVRVATYPVRQSKGAPITRLLIFEREESSGVRPVLFWIHGGGYVVGKPEQDMAFIAGLLERLDIVVASVDYRLAPDHPFPAPLDDCHAALEWVVEHADDLRIDPARVVIGGQSAGGGLAAALVQRVVDQGPIAPVLQLLVYPMLDAMTVARQDDAGTGDFIWTPANNRYGWQSYLGGDPTRGGYPAYAVPAARADLSGLPPAWIGVGTLDLFCAEDRAYAERLRGAGVACEFHLTEGAYHGFDIFRPEAAATVAFNDSLFAALRKALG